MWPIEACEYLYKSYMANRKPVNICRVAMHVVCMNYNYMCTEGHCMHIAAGHLLTHIQGKTLGHSLSPHY